MVTGHHLSWVGVCPGEACGMSTCKKPSSGRDQPEEGESSPGSRTHICKGPGVGMNLMPAEEGVARARAAVAQALERGFPAGTWV